MNIRITRSIQRREKEGALFFTRGNEILGLQDQQCRRRGQGSYIGIGGSCRDLPDQQRSRVYFCHSNAPKLGDFGLRGNTQCAVQTSCDTIRHDCQG